MPSPATLLDAVARRLRTQPPPGISADYAEAFFARHRKALLAMLEAHCGDRCTPEVRPVPQQSGLRIRLADMVAAMQVEGLPAEPRPHTITAALTAAMAGFGARATVDSDVGVGGLRRYQVRVRSAEEAPVLAAFWEDAIPLNGVWQGNGALYPAVEVAGHVAIQLLRLHNLRPEDTPTPEEWSDIFSGMLLERAFVANTALPTVVLRNPVAQRLLWRVEIGRLAVLKGLLSQTEIVFRVAEDGSFADIHDDAIPGGLDERHTLFMGAEDFRTVRLVHPLDLPTADLEQWQQLFHDYEILQAFPQLHRPIHRHTPQERADWLAALPGRRLRDEGIDRLDLRLSRTHVRLHWADRKSVV